jgi:hypothetical protein
MLIWNRNQQRRSRSSWRFRKPRARSNSRTREQHPGWCYYHQIYQARARKCRAPCTWKQGNSSSRRIFVTDVKMNTSFLIDTGADICVYPRSKLQETRRKDVYELFAINGTTIATYGTIPLTLNLRLRRQFKWCFIVADVHRHIIGMDYLSHY